MADQIVFDGYTAASFTVDQLKTLNTAISGGVKSVYYGDKRVEYRSLQEMLTIRRMIMLELGLLKSTDGVKFAQFDKGLQAKTGDCGCGGPDFDNNNPSYNAWM